MENKAVKKVKSNGSNTSGLKILWKKIRKFFRRLIRKIVKFVMNLYNKFMELPKYIRQIVYVWSAVLLLIFALIAISSSNKVMRDKYEKLETLMNEAALDYVESESLYPVKSNKLRLHLEMMEHEGIIYEDYIEDKTCDGFSLVYYDNDTEKYVVNSYIKCKRYVTKDYDINK